MLSTVVIDRPGAFERNPRSQRWGLFLLALALLVSPAREAQATPYTLTARDREELTRLLRTFFEATRDRRQPDIARTIPTPEEYQRIFGTGSGVLTRRHLQAVERDVRELATRFANGTWVGLSGTWGQNNSVELVPCVRGGLQTALCTSGPVIDWTVGTSVQHLRIDRLVRLDGRWKLFDPRL